MSGVRIALDVSWQELRLLHEALCRERIALARASMPPGSRDAARRMALLEALSKRIAGLRLDLLPVGDGASPPSVAARHLPPSGEGREQVRVETILTPFLRRGKPKA